MLSLLLALCSAAAPQSTDLDQLYDGLQEEERVTPEVRVVQAVVPCAAMLA